MLGAALLTGYLLFGPLPFAERPGLPGEPPPTVAAAPSGVWSGSAGDATLADVCRIDEVDLSREFAWFGDPMAGGSAWLAATGVHGLPDLGDIAIVPAGGADFEPSRPPADGAGRISAPSP